MKIPVFQPKNQKVNYIIMLKKDHQKLLQMQKRTFHVIFVNTSVRPTTWWKSMWNQNMKATWHVQFVEVSSALLTTYSLTGEACIIWISRREMDLEKVTSNHRIKYCWWHMPLCLQPSQGGGPPGFVTIAWYTLIKNKMPLCIYMINYYQNKSTK